MQLLSARRERLMFAPSIDLCVRWSVARALSDPARSMRDNFPTRVTMLTPSMNLYSTITCKLSKAVSGFDLGITHQKSTKSRNLTCNIAWERDEVSFTRVGSVVRFLLPC